MGQAIRAFDVLDRNVDAARESVAARLVELGQPADVAESLSSQWVSRGDFLLSDCGATVHRKPTSWSGTRPM